MFRCPFLEIGSPAAFRPSWANLASLEHLNLNFNDLTGGIPPSLAKLDNLKDLWLTENRLTGPVPAALGELDPSVLRLSGNDFDAVPPESTAVAAHDPADTRLCTPPPTSPALFDDCAVLLAVKDSLAGDVSLNWRAAVPVGLWQGVTIGREGRVAALDLRDRNLTGRLPAELGELSHLQVLRLDGNRLTGAIPPELGNLTRLTMLSLDGNRLTGPIPPALANLSNLGQLWLADNRLTGSIPPELAGIERLSLAVAGNDFDGCMPWVLHRLSRHDMKDTLICTFRGNARLLLWRLGFEKAMEAPVFGHGYRALVSMDGAPIGHDGRPAGPHNLYLMLLGEAGIVPPAAVRVRPCPAAARAVGRAQVYRPGCERSLGDRHRPVRHGPTVRAHLRRVHVSRRLECRDRDGAQRR